MPPNAAEEHPKPSAAAIATAAAGVPRRQPERASPVVPLTRSAGVLLHVTSLPGPYGIGDVGPAARQWVDTLAAAGQAWWQVLPLNPPGHGDSPYQAFSAFAGNPLLVSPQLLVEDGLLEPADIAHRDLPAGPVDYSLARALKTDLLARAHERFAHGHAGRPELRDAFDAFRQQHAGWLDGFALYMALRDAAGDRAWIEWDAPLTRRDPDALAAAAQSQAHRIDRHAFEQFLFARQWGQLKAYAAGKGVRIIGDVPIFVSGDSADVWAHPELFLLDEHRKPTAVAGVPPDYFSTTGQRWGNPLYNWDAMAKDDFAWWGERLSTLLELTDLVRVDHFRGFAACWHVPADAPTAEQGQWVDSPGKALLTSVRDHLHALPFIAEDLGVITPDVEALRDGFGLPGMRVLQFAFGSGPANSFLPHNYVRNAIAYTGTHDNDTTVGWWNSLDEQQRREVADYAHGVDADPAGTLCRLAWSSVADLAVTPAQDVLRLGTDCRMNTPGTTAGNWAWRLSDDYAKHDGWAQLGHWTTAYGRRATTTTNAPG